MRISGSAARIRSPNAGCSMKTPYAHHINIRLPLQGLPQVRDRLTI